MPHLVRGIEAEALGEGGRTFEFEREGLNELATKIVDPGRLCLPLCFALMPTRDRTGQFEILDDRVVEQPERARTLQKLSVPIVCSRPALIRTPGSRDRAFRRRPGDGEKMVE